MTARFASALLLLIPWTALPCAAALVAEPPADMVAPPSFTEAVEVNVVTVDVRVTDANGKPLAGLRKNDFELFEDGRRVPVSNFTAVAGGVSIGPAESARPAAPAPVPGFAAAAPSPEDAWTLVVYVDNFNIHPGNRTRAVRQVRDFLSGHLAPGDRVMVVSYELGLKVLLPFTSNPAAINAALAQVEGLAAHGNAIDLQRQQAFREIMTVQEASVSDPVKPLPCPLSIARPAHDFAELRRNETLRTLGALTVLVNSLSGVPGRKAVLHVSDGIPATPGEEVFQFLAELCGGGGGTAGLGRQTPLGGDNNAPENDDTDEEGNRPRNLRQGKPQPLLDPLDELAVYDTTTLGPGTYKAASQAPIDASTYRIDKDLNALVAHANAQRVTLYMLQASGAEGPAAADASMGASDRLFQFASIDRAQRASLQDSLTALASGTGGQAILGVNDLGRDLSRMREDFASYYSLGFVPAHKTGGGEHRLEVRVKRKGAQLRYRESYRDKPVLERAVDRTLAALFYGIEDNPMGVALELGDQAPGPDGSVAVPVRLRIPLFKVAMLKGDGSYEGSLRVLVATRGKDGRVSTVRQIPVPIHIPHKEVLTALGQFYLYTLTLQLAPGEQTVAIGVRDEIAATTSYLSRAVTVGTTLGADATVHRP